MYLPFCKNLEIFDNWLKIFQKNMDKEYLIQISKSEKISFKLTVVVGNPYPDKAVIG